ncbi:DUF2218 domain-containing protein [Terrihabitans sp. B22-R8]|uniref:DUF2218 domain-containing protein n=1 Tax=Terrihabitans sp. B22-R8 TaxID=3425128 RepID=UPI00403CA888
MNQLVARAVVEIANPEPIIAELCDHLTEHDAALHQEGGARFVTFSFGRGRLEAAPGRIELQAEAPDELGLYYMRMTLAGHLKEFAGDADPIVVWTGDGSDIVTPPNFRPVRVAAVRQITPRMRRVTFVGADLIRFAQNEDLHLGLVIPPEGSEFAWPKVGRDGLLQWGEDGPRPIVRYYTARTCEPGTGRIDVDFVLHEDAGPGCEFAARAKAGDMLGLVGPLGGSVRADRDWYLLAGDETALPAIARTLEFLPETTRGIALIEVSGPEEEQELVHYTRIEVRWLHRGAAHPGAPLAEAIRQVDLPSDVPFFVWAACEYQAFKSVRAYLRKERGLKKDEHFAIGYWRAGPQDAHDESGDD